MSTNDTVTLTDNTTGKQVELPVLRPTCGSPTIDISGLPKALGYFTYDPGFVATASCHSNITYLDGEKGVLEYRGYPIEQLAEESSFIEVCYLLFHGNLPNQEELDNFDNIITTHTMLHEAMKRFYSGFI